MSTTEHGRVLLPIARSAIARAVGQVVAPTHPAATAPWLQAPGASFVTLTQQGQLRGCIGTLEAYRPLHQDVETNAVAAALRDPRFAPLRARELEQTDIEVSLLSVRETLAFRSETEALAQLRPGVDGVVFEFGRFRSTFLPQVWEQLPDVAGFMAHLKQKAGLPADFWSAQVRLERYTVTKWREADLPPSPRDARAREAS
jgi:AmmeMemoRadiSam system protein A